MLNVLSVMAGGSIGASLRYGLFLIVQRLAGPSFPAGTLVVNLLGSLLIGILWHVFEEIHLTHQWRLFVFTGLLGGFTTFSTFTRETAQLIKMGAWNTAIMYVALSNILGVVLVIAGYFISRQIMSAT